MAERQKNGKREMEKKAYRRGGREGRRIEKIREITKESKEELGE